jgi:heme o synthase
VTRIFLRLFRLRLALMNAVAALGGYLLFPGVFDTVQLCLLGFAVALLACGGSALNQVLERDLDRLMERTRNRPLPRGDLVPAAAVLLGGAFLAAGLALLFLAGGWLPASLGAVAILWYLAVYTPLKRRTPFALAIGALCGALAPAIGWCVAGGSPFDFRVMLLAGILYLWQIPHFWLLQRRHAEDYRRAGFPLFAPPVKGGEPAPLFRLWMVAMIAGALMLPAFGMVGRHAAFWCVAFFAPLVIACFRHCEPALFASLNLFPLVVTLALCAGR